MGNLIVTYGEEETGHCDRHGDYFFRKAYMNGNYLAGLTAKCPQCGKEQEEEKARLEKEYQEKRTIERYKSYGIDPIFLDCTLDNFIADTEELKKNLAAVRKLVAGEINTILMIGKNGTGKTHLAVAALKELGGHIYSSCDMMATIKKYANEHGEMADIDFVNIILNNNLLVIDEMGRSKGSDFATNWLSYIVDKRYARKMPLIITSNKHMVKDCPSHGCENCLENYVSEDIMSRLAANGLLLKFSGADYRKKRG